MFVPKDESFENFKTIQQVIQRPRKPRKKVNIIFLDLAKSFDSISHKSIRKVLMREGVSVQVIETIKEMYANTCTEISVGGRTTRKIETNSGIKQGCPRSPFLFNLMTDELIEKLKSKNIGVTINGTIINVMAFVDDLVVIAEESIPMIILLEECKQFFELKGLAINTGKYASLNVLPVKEKKSMIGVTRIHRY